MTTLLVAVFVASLAGSLHCAGMCGGIVTLCVSGQPVAGRRPWTPHALYNLGRLGAYATLGAVSGAIGAAIDLGGGALGWGRVAAVVAGFAMIAIGVAALLRSAGVRFGCLRLPRPVQQIFQTGMTTARRLPRGVQPLVIGGLTGLLPCGWLYAFVISAAGAGGPVPGALTMVAFWAGTVPIMLGLGLGVQRLAAPLRRHAPRLTAASLVIIGVLTVFGRVRAPAYAETLDVRDQTVEANAVERVRGLDAATMPCCAEGDAGE